MRSAVVERATNSAEPTDHELVSALRQGDDRAFEALYARYHRQITSYADRMVKDHGRAEDITQEVFVAALRRMRETERPIAFKPWIYGIARNACIDAYRRNVRRAEEVSFDADDRLSPSDHGRLAASGPQPDAAVDAKQDFDHLRGAFGGLSDGHHRILVMRELEGRSYEDIGERMGMSRPAVQSALFRARKRLGEEYDELASGERCVRVQSLIGEAGGARLAPSDRRVLARHLSHCQPCRTAAAHAGLRAPARRGLGGRIAAWLPLPAFLRVRRGGEEGLTGSAGSGGHGAWTAHVPAFADSMNTGWSKAGAGLVALLAAGAGVGVTTTPGGDEREPRRGSVPAPIERAAPSGAAGATSATAPAGRLGSAFEPAQHDTGGGDSAAPRRTGERGSESGAVVGQRGGAPLGLGRPGDAPAFPVADAPGAPGAPGGAPGADGRADDPRGNGRGDGPGRNGRGDLLLPDKPRVPKPPKDVPAVLAPLVPPLEVPAVHGGGNGGGNSGKGGGGNGNGNSGKGGGGNGNGNGNSGRGGGNGNGNSGRGGPVREAVEDVTGAAGGAGQGAYGPAGGTAETVDEVIDEVQSTVEDPGGATGATGGAGGSSSGAGATVEDAAGTVGGLLDP